MKPKELFAREFRYWAGQAALAVSRFFDWWNGRVDCSWCKRRLSGNPFKTAATHGICDACRSDFLKNLEAQTKGEK